MAQIVVQGFNPTAKVPGMRLAVNYGKGLISPGSIPRKLLLIGLLGAGASMSADTTITDVFPSTDENALCGPRSELAQMIRAARATPGVQIQAAAPAAGVGATEATATITYVGTASAAGTWKYFLNGLEVDVNIASGDTPTAQATKAVTAFNDAYGGELPAVASSSAGVVTLTVDSAGLRGNDWTLYQDTKSGPPPAGSTSTLTSPAYSATIVYVGTASGSGTWAYTLGTFTVNVTVSTSDTPSTQATNAATAFNAMSGATLTATASSGTLTLQTKDGVLFGALLASLAQGGGGPSGTTSTPTPQTTFVPNTGAAGEGGVRFGGGTGSESLVNLLAVMAAADPFFTLAVASNDATNAGRVRDYLNDKAEIGSQVYEEAVFGENGSLTAAESLGQTTMNNVRGQVGWLRGSEAHPAVLAAALAAVRTSYDQVHPNQRLDGVVVPGLPPQRAIADRPSGGDTGEQEAALENSVTPLTTSGTDVVIVRSITTLSLRSSVPFYGAIDTGIPRTIDFAAEALQLAWASEFAVNNPWVGPDPAPGQPSAPSGQATPSLWQGYATNLLSAYIPQNYYESVAVTAEYDATNKQLLTQIDLQVTAQNHRIGGNVNQVTG